VRAVEASLRRLVTDRIDVYYLHRFDDEVDLGDSLRTLDDLVRQGKILYTACSNFAAWQVAHALGLAAARHLISFSAVQPMYSLLKRQAEVELLPMAQALGLAVVPYSPTAGGLLTGKYAGGGRPEGARFATNEMYQRRYAEPSYWAAAEAFASLASRLGHKPATLAVAWAAAHPAGTSVLLGARSAEQLEDTLAAAELDLDAETYARVAALAPTPPPATDRSEEPRPTTGAGNVHARRS
jgi:aryl-alcohol dehydrogenase-like predicted oxidoreductase